MDQPTIETGSFKFGSAYRMGHDDPNYQVERLRMLCAFLTKLLDAHSRQLRHTQREARQLWDGNAWQVAQIETLQQQNAESAKTYDELQSWISQLNQAKTWQEGQIESLQKQLTEATQAYEEQRSVIAQLEQEKQHLEEVQSHWLVYFAVSVRQLLKKIAPGKMTAPQPSAAHQPSSHQHTTGNNLSEIDQGGPPAHHD